MGTVKLSSKGQIVIPKAMRDEMHLLPGTEFIISVTATGLTLTPKILFPKATVREVKGFLAKRARVLPDDAEIKASIKARLKAQEDALANL
jgi:AbrB family looped-hinge helix DNA binding protein